MAFLGGLFGGNYAKEGPGVSKDEPKRAPFVQYFVIFIRKFWQLMYLNILFLPVVLVAGVAIFILYNMGSYNIQLDLGNGNMFVKDFWRSYVAPLPVLLLCPFLPGLTFVTRNYVREEHAFIFSDFKDAVKGNWKFFLGNGCLCYLVYFAMSICIKYYALRLDNWIMYVPFGICIVISILFLFAQFYLPVMAITFDLKFKQLYKNAFIFAIIGLGRNFIVVAVAVVCFLYYFFLAHMIPILEVIFWVSIVLIGFAGAMYTVNFIVYPMIDNYLLKNYTDQDVETGQAKETSGFLEDIKPLSEMDEPKSDYVYYNGRLISRAEYEKMFEDE